MDGPAFWEVMRAALDAADARSPLNSAGAPGDPVDVATAAAAAAGGGAGPGAGKRRRA